jgi:hypothetical protein
VPSAQHPLRHLDVAHARLIARANTVIQALNAHVLHTHASSSATDLDLLRPLLLAHLRTAAAFASALGYQPYAVPWAVHQPRPAPKARGAHTKPRTTPDPSASPSPPLAHPLPWVDPLRAHVQSFMAATYPIETSQWRVAHQPQPAPALAVDATALYSLAADMARLWPGQSLPTLVPYLSLLLPMSQTNSSRAALHSALIASQLRATEVGTNTIFRDLSTRTTVRKHYRQTLIPYLLELYDVMPDPCSHNVFLLLLSIQRRVYGPYTDEALYRSHWEHNFLSALHAKRDALSLMRADPRHGSSLCLLVGALRRLFDDEPDAVRRAMAEALQDPQSDPTSDSVPAVPALPALLRAILVRHDVDVLSDPMLTRLFHARGLTAATPAGVLVATPADHAGRAPAFAEAWAAEDDASSDANAGADSVSRYFLSLQQSSRLILRDPPCPMPPIPKGIAIIKRPPRVPSFLDGDDQVDPKVLAPLREAAVPIPAPVPAPASASPQSVTDLISGTPPPRPPPAPTAPPVYTLPDTAAVHYIDTPSAALAAYELLRAQLPPVADADPAAALTLTLAQRSPDEFVNAVAIRTQLHELLGVPAPASASATNYFAKHLLSYTSEIPSAAALRDIEQHVLDAPTIDHPSSTSTSDSVPTSDSSLPTSDLASSAPSPPAALPFPADDPAWALMGVPAAVARGNKANPSIQEIINEIFPLVVGFDVESDSKTMCPEIIQVSVNSDIFIVDVKNWCPEMEIFLASILTHPGVLKTGVGLPDDLRILQQLLPQSHALAHASSCVCLGELQRLITVYAGTHHKKLSDQMSSIQGIYVPQQPTQHSMLGTTIYNTPSMPVLNHGEAVLSESLAKLLVEAAPEVHGLTDPKKSHFYVPFSLQYTSPDVTLLHIRDRISTQINGAKPHHDFGGSRSRIVANDHQDYLPNILSALCYMQSRLRPQQPLGLRGLAKKYARVIVSKDEQTSEWTSRPLSPAQIQYAALDAHIASPIFRGQTKSTTAGALVAALRVLVLAGPRRLNKRII